MVGDGTAAVPLRRATVDTAPTALDADAAAGCLLGLALGDALGAPFEGRSRVDPPAIERLLDATAELRWTDDTHMMLALADSLLDRGGRIDPEHLGDSFARSYRAEPWRGYGSGPPRIFAMTARGRPYLEAAASLFDGDGSLGNGGAMRCAPVAIVGGHDAARTHHLAVEQARVTHTHPEGVDGAVLLAAVVRLALATRADARLRVADAAPAVAELGSPAMRAAWEQLRAAAGDRSEAPDTRGGLLELARRFGGSVAARGSVPAAIAVALARPDGVVDTVRAAISLGGDTDTVAAMAGAITGAHLGAEAIPAALRVRLEARERITTVAAALVDLAPPAGT